MIKKFLIGSFLLFCFFPVFSSSAERLYRKQDYSGVIELLEKQDSFSKQDYILHAKTMYELGKPEQAYPSLVMYLLLCEESDYETEDRIFAVDKFLTLDVPDGITVICLVPSDGKEACMALYRSYSNLGQTRQADFIASNYFEN